MAGTGASPFASFHRITFSFCVSARSAWRKSIFMLSSAPGSGLLVGRVDQVVVAVAVIRGVRGLVAGPVNSVEIIELSASLLFMGGRPSSVSMVRRTLTVV